MIIFLIPLILLIVLAINYYIGWHGAFLLSYYSLPIPPTIYWILFWLITFSYFLGRWIPGPVGRLIKVVGSYYLAIIELSVFLLLLIDLSAWILHLAGWTPSFYVPLLSWSYLLILLGLMGIGSFNAWSPIKRKYHITINKKAGSLKKLRIAMASDLHLGNIYGNRYLQKLVSEINSLQPDLILLPGDILDDVIEPFVRNRMKDTFKKLKSRFGTFAILGNHEYIGGNIDQYVTEMESINIPVLRDEVILIKNSIYIAGRKDKTAEQVDPKGRLSHQELLNSVDSSLPIILMDHQPYDFDQALQAGVDLLLCGHTHRGQIAPNHLITKRLFELDWGYLQKQTMHAIVSSGFGAWGPPIRLGSRSEFIEIIVHFQEPEK